MVAIPFATNAYQNDSLPVSAQQCVNAYAEREPPDTKTPVAVFGTPGITEFVEVGLGPIRGFCEHVGVLYAVSGDELYSVAEDGTTALIGGGITGGTMPVAMSSNGTQLCVVDGTYGFIYNSTTGVYQQIVNANFFSAHTVTFFDQYFVFERSGTAYVFLSGLLDGLSYNSLDTAAAEVQPQDVLATVNQQESLLVFSTGHIETWYDSGAANFPFQRVDGGTIERGLAAHHAVVKEDNSVFFLGDDVVFYRLDGVLPRRISTHAIEAEWQSYDTVADAVCWSQTFNGHKWVFVTFPTGNATWVYDIATGLWHQRVSYDINGNSLGRWVGNCAIRIYERDFVGSAYTGQIGYVDPTVFSEFGNIFPMTLTSPPTHQDRKRVFYANFEVDMETGVGIVSGQGSDPQAMLQWSNDGSRSWSTLQPWRSIGAIGATQTRVRWAGPLGQARQRTWRLGVSDPVKRVVLSARCDVAVGM